MSSGTIKFTRELVEVEAACLSGKRVLIFVENLPVPFDRRVWQEARTLRDAGAVVSIICPIGKGYEKRYENIQGIHVYRHPLPIEARSAIGFLVEYGIALFWEFLLAFKVLAKHGFDIVHVCNPPDLIFLVARPFKWFGKRYIFDHHDISPELYEAKFGKRGFFWRLLCLFERLSFNSADVVISTNESYKEIAMQRGGKKPEDVYVVRSGPDLSRAKIVTRDVSFKKGRKYLVGYVGVMGEQEGLDLLLESIHHLVFKLWRRDIQFVLVGDGPQLKELCSLAESMNIEDYITFTGRVTDEVLFQVLSTAEVCVNPDRVNPMNDKSTMNKILEYMALGKPIIQFDVKEGRFSAGESSLYAKPNDPLDFADKIVRLLDNKAIRDRMGRIGRERVISELAWTYEAPKLISAYLHCLNLSGH